MRPATASRRAETFFRYKFHGLFFVAPAQESLMLRCRIPGCVLKAHQLRGLATIAQQWGGGYSHITTRGNLQIREIEPKDSVDVLVALSDIGLTSKGAGADNVRNITASPTSGIDPLEVLDVLPLARDIHHYILNTREMYDLPRKFNIAFDNGGAVSVCADTNDIAFYASLPKADAPVERAPGFRVQLCGITGHKQFAMDTGLWVTPQQTTRLAAAMLQVFRKNGDRTDRKRARLKYLVDDWGLKKFLAETEKEFGAPLTYLPLEQCEPRINVAKHGYIGAHPQKQPGYSYLGVSVPVGRLEHEQMLTVARIAETMGNGEIRLTVWQNLIIPYIPDSKIEQATAILLAAGLDARSANISNGVVACTGNRGCKYAATDTKGHALQISRELQRRVPLLEPINIHFTGCAHSCAQHYIGDIGLIGCKVVRGEEKVEGYNIVLGGGVDNDQGIAREVWQNIPADEVTDLLADLLANFCQRRKPGQSFVQFTRSHSVEELRALGQPQLS
ncbi:MAG: NirA family protein [Verrucomicrobia bacterium]|nr:NirA family protein [Verrucomicrobiota bacterium]